VTELYIILENFIKNYEKDECEIGIGALTGDERDVWANVCNQVFLKEFSSYKLFLESGLFEEFR
jgi:hypothetical protein